MLLGTPDNGDPATIGVTPTALRLAALLDRPIVASQQSLAEVLGVTARTVRTALAELEAAGRLRRERRADDHGYRIADRLVPVLPDDGLAEVLQLRSTAAEWTPEVAALRDAMLAAGIRVGWGRLRPDVVADITRWVQTLGIAQLVAEAKSRIWNVVRHVAAFLRFWRDLKPARRPTCPFHPAESTDRGRPCPACAAHRARSVPMPDELRYAPWRRRHPLILSA